MRYYNKDPSGKIIVFLTNNKNVTMGRIIIILITILVFSQCSKRKQYSTWSIDGVEYSSNSVEVSSYRGLCNIRSDDKVRFSLTFWQPSLPTNEHFFITRRENLGIGKVSIGICRDTICYGISPHETKSITAVLNKSKAQYIMLASWFVNFADPLDSILVEGTFNEP